MTKVKKKNLNTVKNGVSTWTYCSVGVVVDYEDTTKAIQGHIGGLRLTLKEQPGEIKYLGVFTYLLAIF